MTPPLDDHTDAGSRLRRLLGMLAYLARVGEASIAELATRFSMDESTVVAELELAACCGLPPYTPDQLLELVVDGDQVHAFGLDALRQPPRLTPTEGFAVAAAARAILGVGGADEDAPLGRALRKLEAALGSDRVAVELERPEHLGALRAAAIAGDVVEIDYLGQQRGDESRRVVEPYVVVAREGRFYLDAFCRQAGDWRRFQVDRVTAVRPTGEHVEPRAIPPELTGPQAFAGGPATRRVLIEVPVRGQLLLERVAAGPGTPSGPDRVVVPVDVGDEVWLGLLMLRLGPDARVIEPAAMAGARVRVATRALARYRGHGAGGTDAN